MKTLQTTPTETMYFARTFPPHLMLNDEKFETSLTYPQYMDMRSALIDYGARYILAADGIHKWLLEHKDERARTNVISVVFFTKDDNKPNQPNVCMSVTAYVFAEDSEEDNPSFELSDEQIWFVEKLEIYKAKRVWFCFTD